MFRVLILLSGLALGLAGCTTADVDANGKQKARWNENAAQSIDAPRFAKRHNVTSEKKQYVLVAFKIGADGRVTYTKVVKQKNAAPETLKAIKNLVENSKFPPPPRNVVGKRIFVLVTASQKISKEDYIRALEQRSRELANEAAKLRAKP